MLLRDCAFAQAHKRLRCSYLLQSNRMDLCYHGNFPVLIADIVLIFFHILTLQEYWILAGAWGHDYPFILLKRLNEIEFTLRKICTFSLFAKDSQLYTKLCMFFLFLKDSQIYGKLSMFSLFLKDSQLYSFMLHSQSVC